MNKVVLITGASSGFGKVTAETLAAKGYKVYGTSRHEHDDSTLPYEMLEMDVTDQDQVSSAVGKILSRHERIDVLVNNAGISAISALEETPMEALDQMLATNVKGMLRVCQAVLPGMREHQKGLIINISSIAGLMGLPFRGLYATGKFAVEGLTESLSMEVKPFGVTVCLVEPGDFNTAINQNRKIIKPTEYSVYHTLVTQLVETVQTQVANAPDPKPVAELILRIIQTPSPKLRYRVGSFTEKFSVVLKTVIPGRWFERLIMKFHNM